MLGILRSILAFGSRLVGGIRGIGGWLARFPAWLRGLFSVGGSLAWVGSIFGFVSGALKHPVVWVMLLVTSSFFPSIVEKIFLVVGAVSLRIFLVIFRIGKSALSGLSSSEGGLGAVDQFRDVVLGSFDDLPVCMVNVMGYLHLVENLGLIVTSAIVILIYKIYRAVYSGFKVTGNSAGL